MGLSKAQEAAAVILLAAGAGEISLAGGSGLIAHGVVDRDTKDLDAFTRDARADTVEIARRVAAAFEGAGYRVVDDSLTADSPLRRLLVSLAEPTRRGRPPERVQIEIGVDYQALPSVPTRYGPALSPIELGANKIITVYDATRARDADDIARLTAVLSFDRMLEVADSKCRMPLDRRILAAQMMLLTRVDDAEFTWLPAERARAVKAFIGEAAEWVRDGRPVDPCRSPYTEAT